MIPYRVQFTHVSELLLFIVQDLRYCVYDPVMGYAGACDKVCRTCAFFCLNGKNGKLG
jgi:hypothetical protein